MTLDKVLIGQEFRIDKLTACGEIRRRLVDMGFVNGARGIVLRKALFGDPIELRIGASLISVRESEAQRIQVEF